MDLIYVPVFSLFILWLYFLLRGWGILKLGMVIGLQIVSILLLVVSIILFLFLMLGAIIVISEDEDLGALLIPFLVSIVSFVLGCAGIAVSFIKIGKLWKLRH